MKKKRIKIGDHPWFPDFDKKKNKRYVVERRKHKESPKEPRGDNWHYMYGYYTGMPEMEDVTNA